MKTEYTRSLALALTLAVVPFLGACEGAEMEEEVDPGFETETPVMDEQDGMGMDQDGMGDVGTMGAADFNQWDADQSGYVTQEEFNTGWRDQDVFNEWDTDGDSYLNENEFNTAFQNEDWFEDNLFGEWDADGDEQLTQDEVGTGLYDAWDANDDDQLTQDEIHWDLF